MSPLSMESIFLLLSGAIVLAGVLYWFWSHIQLTQKKVQLLENAVFELRGMVTGPGPGPGPAPAPAPASAPSSGGNAGPGPAPVYNDLGDDDWEEPEEKRDDVRTISTPLEDLGSGSGSSAAAGEGPVLVTREVEETVPDDLQPGGRIIVPTEEEFVEQENFRELFVSRELPAPANSPAVPAGRAQESLDSMPVKELRRLAEQRGIAGAADMRKKEILAALRNQITNTVTIEKALDLTAVEEETAAEVAVAEAAEETVEAEILE